MAPALIVVGLMLVAAGFLWPWLSRIGLGRLRWDIVVERQNSSFYVAITTCLLISIIASLLLWLFNR